MGDYLGPLHTPGNAIPAVDDDLAGVLADLDGVHYGIDQIRHGLESLAMERLTKAQTQTVLYSLAGAEGTDILTALTLLITRLTNPDTNPTLRNLPLDRQKDIQHLGEQHAHLTEQFAPRQTIADAIAHIDTP
ncbi:hypothetical protein HY68_37035 [Streptomyces sp. AcH 505]|uniref:hypothetical protein n=1 Tax=Streptomyces sp. AcH 505 TaxID=352211 RepID=UPI000592076A|nr:hypothetical protein HY68_37035 [Streptomyces sp. AcH 505]